MCLEEEYGRRSDTERPAVADAQLTGLEVMVGRDNARRCRIIAGVIIAARRIVHRIVVGMGIVHRHTDRLGVIHRTADIYHHL